MEKLRIPESEFFKKNYLKVNEVFENKRITDKPLVNFKKIYSNYIEDILEENKNSLEPIPLEQLFDQRFYRYSLELSYTLNNGDRKDMTQYLTSVGIISDYLGGKASYFSIKAAIPNFECSRILKQYNENKNSVVFYMNILPIYTKNENNHSVLYSSGSSLIPNFKWNDPFSGLKLKLIDPSFNIMSSRNSLLEIDGLPESDQRNYPDTKFEVELFPDVSRTILRTSVSGSYNNKTILECLKDLGTKVNEANSLNPLEPIKFEFRTPDNEQNIINFVSTFEFLHDFYNRLESEVGVFYFGGKLFSEGRYLSLFDNQREITDFEKEENPSDIYIEILKDNNDLDVISPDSCYIHNNPVTKIKDIYLTINESSVSIKDNYFETKEKGERISIVSDKEQLTDLLLPRNLCTDISELDNSDFLVKIKTLRKKELQTGLFFETKIISEYNDSIMNVNLTLEGVDMDILTPVKHLYLHFYNPNYYKYNGKYKIVNKLSNLSINRGGELFKIKNDLTLIRVVDEMTYNDKDLKTNDVSYKEVPGKEGVIGKVMQVFGLEKPITNEVSFDVNVDENLESNFSGLRNYTKEQLDNIFIFEILKVLLKNEGGYVPSDVGSQTYRGIRQFNWPDWEGWDTIMKLIKNHNPNWLREAKNQKPDLYVMDKNLGAYGCIEQEISNKFIREPYFQGLTKAEIKWLIQKRNPWKRGQYITEIDSDIIYEGMPRLVYEFYNKYFRKANKLDDIINMSPGLALNFFDFAINAGSPRAKQILKSSLDISGTSDMEIILNSLKSSLEKKKNINNIFTNRRKEFYNKLGSRSNNRVHLPGWLKRTAHIYDLSNQLEVKV
jgi:hypothetical protein